METVTKKMNIRQVLEIDPDTAPIMMSFGLHCLGCPFSQMETLEDGCMAHGKDPDELVAKINEFLASKK